MDVLVLAPEHKAEAVVTISIVACQSLAFSSSLELPSCLGQTECGEVPSAQCPAQLGPASFSAAASLTGIKLLALSHNLPEILRSHQSFNVI